MFSSGIEHFINVDMTLISGVVFFALSDIMPDCYVKLVYLRKIYSSWQIKSIASGIPPLSLLYHHVSIFIGLF